MKSKSKSRVTRIMSLTLCLIMLISTVTTGAGSLLGIGTQTVEAKNIGRKNESQWQACDSVTGTSASAPADYNNVYDKNGNAISGVYVGGEAFSKHGKYQLDNDDNDFAKPLPYGDTYIDTSKLVWDNPSGFIIDIRDDRFVWAGAKIDGIEDANGNKPTNDPMYENAATPVKRPLSAGDLAIYYVGELQPYHANINAAPDLNGHTNIIEPEVNTGHTQPPDKPGEAPYLYRVTYINAVTLPDGTKGNLVLTMKQVQIETSVGVSAANPYAVVSGTSMNTPAGYTYTKALVKVQGANQFSNVTDAKDDKGNFINQRYSLFKTASQIQSIVDAANAALPNGQKLPNGFRTNDKYIRNALGTLLDLEIEVVDAEGKPVNGTISYAAHDMDFESAQDVWGRSGAVKNNDGINTYAEGITIVEGAKSYALIPEYDHSTGTTIETGWVPSGPGEAALTHPLHVGRVKEGSYANGLHFSSNMIAKYRDANGTYDNLLFTATEMVTYQGVGFGNNDNVVKNKWGEGPANPINDNGKKLAYYRVKDKYRLTSWEQVTPEMIWDVYGKGAWKTYRNDADANLEEGLPASFDTGFAVLLSAKKSHLQWSGSRLIGASINTSLFDSSVYTYVEQTHGTGGGIYLESYDMSNSCAPVMREGVVTMGRHSDVTITVVPEDGYRVNRILIGDTNYGKGSGVSGLQDYNTYIIDGNNIKDASGKVLGSFPGATGKVELTGFAYDFSGERETTTGKIVFERNADGTVDVTLPYVDNPMHVHADFGADYYFYKVWKEGEPTSLNMTVAPAGIYPTEVTLPVPTGTFDSTGAPITQSITFEIDQNVYEATGGTFTYNGKVINIKGYDFKLTANNTIEYVEVDKNGKETIVIRPNVIKLGNEFVHYTTNSAGERVIDKTYPIDMEERVADWDGPEAKTFEVDDIEKYTNGGYVTVLGKDDAANTLSPGNVVWKIKYPSEGVAALGWPELPVEKEPEKDNHLAHNHHSRNFWFAIEEVPTWSTESYDNTNAKIPGKAPARYKDSNWYASTIADNELGETLVHVSYKHGNAYLSVFENGGEIVNVPSIVVRGVKEWDDLNNAFSTRQDIWVHIDVKVTNNDGSVTEKKDVLPPQKIAADATGSDLQVQWGNKKSYDTGDSAVRIAATDKHVPSSAKTQSDGSYKLGNTIYWVNELKKVDSDGNTYEYSIRETLDREGKKPVAKSDSASGLIGYISKDTADWAEMSAERTASTKGLSGVDAVALSGDDSGNKVARYTGTLKNTLERVDFTVTKIWKENGANRTHTLASDTEKLKAALTLNESGEPFADIDGLKLQPSTAEAYNASTKKGTLEFKNGKDKTEVIITWHNIPKYVADGNGGIREAVYSVTEDQLDGYNAPVYSGNDEAPDKGTITNEVTPPTGEDRETYGEKNKPQSTDGYSMFTVTTETAEDGTPNKIEKVELLDENGKPASTVKVKGGTYTIDENGKITFTPDKDFTGDPPAVKVRGTDSNGLSATAEYQPHIVDVVKKVTRTITYEYSNGDPVLDENGKPLTEIQTVEFYGTLNPDTGEVVYPTGSEQTFPKVDSDEIDGYNVDRETVGEAVVYPNSDDLFEKVIYSPKGINPTADVTYGLPGQPQKGYPSFEAETQPYTDGTPNTVTVKLIDPATGEPTDSKTVKIPGQGTYTLNDDGSVTFMPEDGYVGNPDPIKLEGTDRFGNKARTTYTPHIVDPQDQGNATRTIHYRYLTEDGKEVTGDVTQTLTLKRHAVKVDPKTGKVLEWGPWEPGTFKAVPNPNDKVDLDKWFTNDLVKELTVTKPGAVPDEYVIYEKLDAPPTGDIYQNIWALALVFTAAAASIAVLIKKRFKNS